MRAAGAGRAWLVVLAGSAVTAVAVAWALVTAGQSEAATLALVGAGLVPAAVYAVFHVNPAIAATAGVCLLVFAGNWQLLGMPLPLDRACLAIALGGVVWRAVQGRGAPLRFGAVHLLVLMAAVAALGSALVAGTITEKASYIALLDRFTLVGFLLFALAPAIFPTARERGYLAGGLLVLGAYLSATAVAEGLGIDPLVFPRGILDETVGLHVGRARGPFLEAAANGLGLVFCAAGCYVAWVTWRSPRSRTIAAWIGVACLMCTVFTLTRQVWLGAGAGVLAAGLATPQLRGSLGPAAVIAAVGALVAFTAVPGLDQRASERTTSDLPIYDRLNSNAAGMRMLADRPLLGFGWDRFRYEAGPYYRLSPDYPLTTVGKLHNVPLSHLVELGVVGGGLWLLAFAAALWKGLRRRPSDPEVRAWWTATIMVVTCFVVLAQFTPLDYAFGNVVVWLMLGVLLGTRSPRAGTQLAPAVEVPVRAPALSHV